MKYTKQQSELINFALNKTGIVLVPAGAGCGKTFIAQQIVNKLQPRDGLYTAFNKAIVEESKEKFYGTNMECKTLHSLAYKYVSPKKNGVRELSYNEIEEDLTYPEKASVIDAINLFFVSSSTDMYDFIENELQSEKLQIIATSYIDKMVTKEIPCSFGFMLKYFHLMLHEGAVCQYDIVILDEINDTTAVALEIFKLIKAPIKIGLGESNQAIYHFLNLKDGFKELTEATKLPLTNSFRCSTKIASDIQKFMRTWADHEFNFTGTDNPVANGNTLYVTRTNAAIILIIKQFISMNKGFTLLRKIKEIFAYPMAIVNAAGGKKVYAHKYKFLEKEYKNYKLKYWQKISFYTYLLETIKDQETESAISLLMNLQNSGTNIFQLYKDAENAEVDPSVTISTVFTAKGLEYENVHINDDMNSAVTKVINNGGVQSEEDLVVIRCYYVATSRCGVNLHNALHFMEK